MRHKSIKRFGLVTALALVGLAVAGDALALPDTGYRIRYFEYDPVTDTYSPAGKEVLSCNGRYTQSGYETEYYVEEDQPCNIDSGGTPTQICGGFSDDVCHYYSYMYW